MGNKHNNHHRKVHQWQLNSSQPSQFYISTAESIWSSSVTARLSSASSCLKARLQWTVRTAERLPSQQQLSYQELHYIRAISKLRQSPWTKYTQGTIYFRNSGKQYCSIRTSTTWHLKSIFSPTAVTLLKKPSTTYIKITYFLHQTLWLWFPYCIFCVIALYVTFVLY